MTVALKGLGTSAGTYEADFLLDTGATDCLAPAAKLRQIEVQPVGTMAYELADGTKHACPFGLVEIRFMGEITAGRVVFGPDDAEPVLGVTALESVGITIDPASRTPKRLPAIPLKRIIVAPTPPRRVGIQRADPARRGQRYKIAPCARFMRAGRRRKRLRTPSHEVAYASSMKKPGVKCTIAGCAGKYEARTVVHPVKRRGEVIVIDHVPAEVCNLRGDVLLTPETVRRIEALLDATPQPLRTVPLYEFACVGPSVCSSSLAVVLPAKELLADVVRCILPVGRKIKNPL